MEKGKIIVFTGSDSVGCATQARLLADFLKSQGQSVWVRNFPSYEETSFGKLVGAYLRGEYGRREQVPIEAIALLFALDRYQFGPAIREKLDLGVWIVMGRYKESNWAFQSAGVHPSERAALLSWMKQTEVRLPDADATFLLRAPLNVAARWMRERPERPYMAEVPVMQNLDIHERSLDLQQEVRRVYEDLARQEGWITIDYVSDEGSIFNPAEVHERVVQELKRLHYI